MRASHLTCQVVGNGLLRNCALESRDDERSGEGLLRYVVLRVNHVGRVLVTLVTAADELPDGEALARALLAERPDVVGVVQNINTSRGNTLYGEREQTLAGDSWLEEHVGPVQLRLSSTAFFQVNRDVAARIVVRRARVSERHAGLRA